MKKRLLVISADAMVDEDLEYLSTLPNFKKYLSGGVKVKRVRSIYPTLTYPAHVSILTGCFPNKTGIVNNIVYSTDPSFNDWEWDASHIRVSDIFAAAKKGGYSTAAVLWPVTGNNKNIDYLVNEIWMPHKEDTLESCFRGSGSSDEVIEIIKHNEKYLPGTYWKTGQENFAIHPIFDNFGIKCACEIIRTYKPDVFFIHTSPLDNIRHQYGIFSDKLPREIRRIDEQIGEVCEALEDAGVLADTNIALISDHGQMDTDRLVNVNVLLRQAGYLDLKDDGTLADGWQAYCIGVGMCAYVYLGRPDNKELRDRLYAQLKSWAEAGIYGFRQVFTVEETEAAEGLGGDFSFVLETDGYTGFGTACEGPYVKPNSLHEDYHYAHGKHGYLPDKGPQPVFVAKGPDFASGNTLVPFCRLVDEAPTFASLLGVSMPEADGKPVLEILK